MIIRFFVCITKQSKAYRNIHTLLKIIRFWFFHAPKIIVPEQKDEKETIDFFSLGPFPIWRKHTYMVVQFLFFLSSVRSTEDRKAIYYRREKRKYEQKSAPPSIFARDKKREKQ